MFFLLRTEALRRRGNRRPVARHWAPCAALLLGLALLALPENPVSMSPIQCFLTQVF